MKNKKLFIILCVVCSLIILGLVFFFTFNKKEEFVYIYFDSQGGSNVEKIKINKEGTIQLPNTSKDGYQFLGWYDGDFKVSASTRYNENTTLIAKWASLAAKTYTITFDSQGGDVIDNLIVECGKEVKFPAKPKKTGYEFVSWIDQNETPILDGALLECADITLKANWKKVEEKKTDTKKETKTETKAETKPETNPEAVVEQKQPIYSCSEGNLSGDKCIIEKDANTKCPSGTYEYNGSCVTVNNSVRKTGDYSCPTKNIGSYAKPETGELDAGTYLCYYHKLSYNSQSQCESLSDQYGKFVWRASNSSCYVTMTNASMSCDNVSGHIYIGNPNQFNGVNGLNAGCFPTSSKEKYCDDDYTLSGDKCIKTIPATVSY